MKNKNKKLKYFHKNIHVKPHPHKYRCNTHTSKRTTMDDMERPTTKQDVSMTKFHEWIALAKLDSKVYQEEGVKKMLTLETDTEPLYGCRGGFMTDEMGLGKTIQMLSLLLINPVERTLIVLPRVLLDQWECAIYKFFGHKPLIYHGTRKHEKPLETSPVVLTTYGTVALRKTKSGTETPSPLRELKWGRIIYDEAHHLRNKGTSGYKGASKLKSNISWFVTGTPIQNALSDVYSLMNLLGVPKDVYSTDEGLRNVAEHFRIGRTKKDVGIELPDVETHHIMVDWKSDAELNIACDLHSILDFSNVTSANVDNLISALTHHKLPALLRMRQSCLQMSMLKEAAKNLICLGMIKEDDIRDGMETQSKLDKVIDVIEQRKSNGNSKIIFSYFHSEIDALSKKFTEMGMTVGVVDGRTTQKQRDLILTTTYDVLILQIQSSCEGLNLQTYNEIYFTSPHWNPAVHDQAIARAHRIGQKKTVHVFNFEMEGFGDGSKSIDSYCMEIQRVKRRLYTLF